MRSPCNRLHQIVQNDQWHAGHQGDTYRNLPCSEPESGYGSSNELGGQVMSGPNVNPGCQIIRKPAISSNFAAWVHVWPDIT